MYALEGSYSLVECSGCGLRFLNPQPEFQKLARHYPQQYYAYQKLQNAERNQLECLYEKLYDVLYGPSFKQQTLIRWLFLPCAFLMPGTTVAPGRRFLDVGCGAGYMVERMARWGMEAVGIEADQQAVKAANQKGIRVFQGYAAPLPFSSETFDVVTMHATLEHVPDPQAALNEVFRVLKAGGVAHISVPNRRSLAAFLFGQFWIALDAPRHLFIFTPRLLREFARKAGFQIKSTHYRPALVQSFFGSIHYWWAARIGADTRLSASRVMKTQWRLLLLPFCMALCALRLGDSVEVIFQKP